MPVRHGLRLLLPVLILLASPFARAEDARCPADPLLPALHLPHLAAALLAGRPARIVALGSSSTEGVMASAPEEAYPAELQEVLRDALPGARIAVINRGIGGQDAHREFARLDRDAIARRPQVVIWQVGANAALHRADPAAFRRLVIAGVRRLQGRGIDVVLMDNQRSPRILESGDDGVFDRTLARIARMAGAGLFSRDQLMRVWAREGDPESLFVASDRLHHNDRGYRCVAEALGRAIVAGLPAEARMLTAGR